MIRGTFANIRLKNLLLDGVEGGFTRNFLSGGEQTTIYDASVAYQAAGTPLVILAGKEYGSGSSRDWAAKGTALLGVRAVIAESFERIHRSNLVGMGVLPLQFKDGESAQTLGITFVELSLYANHVQSSQTVSNMRSNLKPDPCRAFGEAHRRTSDAQCSSLTHRSGKVRIIQQGRIIHERPRRYGSDDQRAGKAHRRS